MRRLILAGILMAVLPTAGCWAGYTTTASNQGAPPDLVYAAPGVQVVADWDEPIFYTDSFYWRFYSGHWYRSRRHTGGWVYAAPPLAVRRIEQPRAFVHYRPRGWVSRRESAPAQPRARDQRGDWARPESRRGEAARPPVYQQSPPRAAQPPPRAAQPPPRAARPAQRGRDHRDDDRDERGDDEHHEHRE